MKNVYSVRQVNRLYQEYVYPGFYAEPASMSKGKCPTVNIITSGHIYFSLKDESGTMACVMFAGAPEQGCHFRMQEGQQVIVLGCGQCL